MTYSSDRYKQKQNTHKETSTPPYSHWLQLVSDPGAARQNNKLLYCHKWDGRIRISLFFPTFSPASAHRKKYIKTSTKRTPVLQLCVWMAVTILSHSVPSIQPKADAMICVRCTNAYAKNMCQCVYSISIRICSSVVAFS